jgi:hypothetical protein
MTGSPVIDVAPVASNGEPCALALWQVWQWLRDHTEGFWVEHGELYVRTAALPPALKAAIAHHRDALVAILEAPRIVAWPPLGGASRPYNVVFPLDPCIEALEYAATGVHPRTSADLELLLAIAEDLRERPLPRN